MNFPGGFVIFLLFLLSSEERVPKQSKQVSIVDRIPMLVKLSYNFVLTHAWKNVVTAKYSVYIDKNKYNTVLYTVQYSICTVLTAGTVHRKNDMTANYR